MDRRKLGVIVGSVNDLVQCERGLKYLKRSSKVEVRFVRVISAHRNREKLFDFLPWLVETQAVDVIIAAAGWAAILPGVIESFLRYEKQDTSIHVFGVALEDPKNSTHTEAAMLSITQLPGIEVIYDNYVGSQGFYRACRDAVEGTLPLIQLAKAKESFEFTLETALATIKQMKEGGPAR
jgi:phosphoribosylcarboxyaminoimidazole (NCAIR) mutase